MKLTIKEYMASRNTKNKTCKCPDCGVVIKTDRDHCFSFGLYLCFDCAKKRNLLDIKW